MADFSSDTPLTDPADDRFNRWPLAQRLADALAHRQDRSCLVVAVHGAWGEGKTTLLQFVRRALEAQENVICLPFNPWRLVNEDAMLTDFYEALARQVAATLRRWWERVGAFANRFLKVPASLVGRESVVKLAAEMAGSPSVETLRDRIQEALRTANARVVVLMDDIDRLTKPEVRALVRLVKLNADLENVTYILAFDNTAVAHAIGGEYGADPERAGQSFLEKIVQVPLMLPPADPAELRRLCLEIVDTSLAAAGIVLNERQAQDFALRFNDGLECRVLTPRAAFRFGNALAFALPMLKGEVDPVDQMLLEGMRVFYPALYNAVARHREAFLEGAGRGHEAEQRKLKAKAEFDAAVACLSTEEIAAATNLICRLFPRMEGVFRNVGYGSEVEDIWTSQRRVASREYVDRYFSYSVPTHELPDARLEGILESVNAGDDEAARLNLDELLSGERAASLVTKLRRRHADLSERGAVFLAEVIARYGDRYQRGYGMMSFQSTFSQAAMLVSQLVEQVSPRAERVNIGRHIVAQPTPLAFAAECLRWMDVRDKPPKPEEFTEKETAVIREAFAARGEFAGDGSALFMGVPVDDAVAALAEFRNARGRDAATTLVDNACDADPGRAIGLLKALRSHVTGLDSGITTRGAFEGAQYKNLSYIVDPEMIKKHIERRFPAGALDITGDYPRRGLVDEDVRVATQFLWVHEHQQDSDAGSGKSD